ncbi:MAG: carbon-nitrogen hydrolase family protein [Rhodospirillaceae bacterium]|nr:carbon-nitrogen hydrolase family protein [Rhodospirillaceae bacterium]
MTGTFTAACLQVNAGEDMMENVRVAADLTRAARSVGADLVLMPENVAMMAKGRADMVARAEPEETHRALAAFRALAQETGAWLHCGSLAVRLAGGLLANRTYLLDGTGAVRAVYDKIHMFDVDLGAGESYRESETFLPGNRAVLASTPWGGLGLSICYDLRFPMLYRRLAQAGASFLAVPAAFTETTGRAHWHVLLRARAIENGCYVFAPAQGGEHAGGRRTFGHALIIAPWGEVLADAGEGPGFITAKIDPAQVARARGRVPSFAHDRPFTLDAAK